MSIKQKGSSEGCPCWLPLLLAISLCLFVAHKWRSEPSLRSVSPSLQASKVEPVGHSNESVALFREKHRATRPRYHWDTDAPHTSTLDALLLSRSTHSSHTHHKHTLTHREILTTLHNLTFFSSLSLSPLDRDATQSLFTSLNHALPPITLNPRTQSTDTEANSYTERNSNHFTLCLIASQAIQHSLTDFPRAVKQIQRYAAFYNHSFVLIDPQPIIDRHGGVFTHTVKHKLQAKRDDVVKLSKSLVMLHTLRKAQMESLTEHFPRNNHWLVFLDADVFIANPNTLSLNDLVRETQRVLLSRHCQVIAQLSKNTINTGVMLWRVSAVSDVLLRQWTALTHIAASQHTDWQHEQGVFQQLYLLYLQRYLYRFSSSLSHTHAHALTDLLSESVNCLFPRQRNRLGIASLSLAELRGKCFSRSLLLLNALPLNLSLPLSHAQTPLHMCMVTGVEDHHSTRSHNDGLWFNVHDWPGKEFFRERARNQENRTTGDGEFEFVLHDTRRRSPETDVCRTVRPLFYHGKDAHSRAVILSTSEQTSLEPFDFETAIDNTPKTEAFFECRESLLSLLRGNAEDTLWLIYGWKERFDRMYQIVKSFEH